MSARTSQMEISKLLRFYEERLFESAVRKNREAVSSLLAEEFREFGSSGRVYDRQEIVASLQLESPVHISIQDFRAQLLSDRIALVTYISRKDEPGKPPGYALRSSLWVAENGQWKMIFHQGTMVPPVLDPSPEDRQQK